MIYFEEAFRVLLANPVRTFLTIIGLIIGVGAVISIEVLGHSMAGSINETLGALADNSFIIFPVQTQKDFQKASLRLTDLDEITSSVPNVSSATVIGGVQELFRYEHNVGRFFMSADSNPPFANEPIKYGRTIDDDDIAQALDVVVISWKAYQRLFPDGGDPTGKSIYGGSRRYLVIGVRAQPRQGALNVNFGGDLSIPYTTYLREFVHGNRIFAARFTVNDPSSMTETEAAVIKRIRELRQVGSDVRYQTFDKAQFTQGVNSIFSAVTIVVGLIGAVSLLVAGIGVMNIMLVSITERTKEIGTRKAIGARRGQILTQFFIESALLSSIGCFTGMAIGLGIGGFVNSFFIVKLTGYTASLPYLQSFLITAIFAAIVTLAFGTYPAFRAAGLDPIEALRYE
ncbi:MAG TPA: ABC transporter permease [Candidatus Aquilonibacter sp.]|nr:ABC transporter permease [Candidatus Aquilonibacter sp.]